MAEGHYTQTATQVPVLNELLSSGRPRKLRESCTQCSSSKVKCNKTKPTCERCVRRGLACEYGISRRTGRNRAASAALDSGVPTHARPSRRSSTAKGYSTHSRHTSLSDSVTVCSAGTPHSTRSHTPQYMPPSPPFNTPDTINSLGKHDGYLAPVPQFKFDYWNNMEAGVDDLLTNMSSPSFPIAEAALDRNLNLLNLPHDPFMEVGIHFEDGFMSSGGDHSEYDFNAFTPSLSSSSPSSDSSASTRGCTDNTGNDGGFFPNTLGCCLITALSMMSRLFPNAGVMCTMTGTNESGDSCRMRTVESVISDNTEVIKSLTPLLDCPCTQDEYILSVVALVVFKVLDSYAVVAGVEGPRQQQNALADNLVDWSAGMSTPSSLAATAGSHLVDGTDQSHMAAQLVLSELQSVHRLINALSIRLEHIQLLNSRLHDSPSGSTKGSIPRSATSSVPMLEQLEQDLRGRLKAVSSGIVEQMHHT